MIITLTIKLDVKHVSGKFANKTDLAELLAQEIADQICGGEVETDDEATYEFELDEVTS